MESINVRIDDSPQEQDKLGKGFYSRDETTVSELQFDEDIFPKYQLEQTSQPSEQGHISLLSIIEPKNFDQASQDKSWNKAMEEEIT